MAKRGGGYNLCAALYCNHNRKRNPNLSFFRFPKNPKVCRQWIINSKRFDLLNKEPTYLYANCILCSEHFSDSQFTSQQRNRLLDMAIPTKFPIGMKSDSNELLDSVGDEICEQIEKQMKSISPGAVSKGTKVTTENQRMISTSIFSESKALLSTKTVTFSSKPRIITTQIPASQIQNSEVTVTNNSARQMTSVSTNDKPRVIWLTGLPVSQTVQNKPGTSLSSVVSAVMQPSNTAVHPNIVPMPAQTITPISVDPSDCFLPETKYKIPGTSESTNNNFAPTADFSYQGSYDGSHCGNSVLQDSTNNMDASYDNTYDTIYDDSVAPPPIKRKRPTSSSDNLNENYQAFSELVVAKLKSLPANRAALLQLKIQELLSREIVNLEMDEGDNETEEEVCGEQEGEEEEEMSLETGSKPNEIETPPSRSEECPNETTQVEHKTTTTTTSVTTTIAKKRKVAPAQVHDSAENKENAQVFLDDSYRAFSKCIVSQLRYLPTPVAVKTQNKIQRVLSDEISEFYNKTASASQEPEETSPSIRVKEEPLDYNDS